jgi:hypothetical protein
MFPETFDDQRELLRLLRLKHIADAGASVLIPFLTEKGINLNDDFAAGNSAETHDALMKTKTRGAELGVQTRDLKFGPVFKNTKNEIQFLKAFYKPTYATLGDWGVTVDGGKRINLPVKFVDKVTLVRAIKTKFDSYGGVANPLSPFLTEHLINLTTEATLTNQSETANNLQLDARRDAEEETELRDNIWDPQVEPPFGPLPNLQACTNYLFKLFKGNEKKCGEWGITVDSSARAPKLRTSTIKLSDQITLKGVVIGSTLTNVGTVAVKVYKGSTATGTFDEVFPAGLLGIKKGFSTITVVNTSALVSAKIKNLIST